MPSSTSTGSSYTSSASSKSSSRHSKSHSKYSDCTQITREKKIPKHSGSLRFMSWTAGCPAESSTVRKTVYIDRHGNKETRLGWAGHSDSERDSDDERDSDVEDGGPSPFPRGPRGPVPSGMPMSMPPLGGRVGSGPGVRVPTFVPPPGPGPRPMPQRHGPATDNTAYYTAPQPGSRIPSHVQVPSQRGPRGPPASHMQPPPSNIRFK